MKPLESIRSLWWWIDSAVRAFITAMSGVQRFSRKAKSIVMIVLLFNDLCPVMSGYIIRGSCHCKSSYKYSKPVPKPVQAFEGNAWCHRNIFKERKYVPSSENLIYTSFTNLLKICSFSFDLISHRYNFIIAALRFWTYDKETAPSLASIEVTNMLVLTLVVAMSWNGRICLSDAPSQLANR